MSRAMPAGARVAGRQAWCARRYANSPTEQAQAFAALIMRTYVLRVQNLAATPVGPARLASPSRDVPALPALLALEGGVSRVHTKRLRNS